MKKYFISGRVINLQDKGVARLRVEAWDRDLIFDDFVDKAVTDQEGRFQMEFDEFYFQEIFDRHPDSYFKVFYRNNLILDSRDSVWRNVADENVDITLQVDVPVDSHPEPKPGQPYLLPTSTEEEVNSELKIQRVPHPLPDGTLGDIGVYLRVAGPEEFSETILVQPFELKNLLGIDALSIRMFRQNTEAGTLEPVWNSGINKTHGFIWAKIRRPGLYVPLGLPRDRLLQESLRAMAYERNIQGASAKLNEEITSKYLSPFIDMEIEKLEELRGLVTRFEINTTHEIPREEYNVGTGGHPQPFHLPRGQNLQTFKTRLQNLRVSPAGLPEEHLFRPPELSPKNGTPWPLNPEQLNWYHWEREFLKLKLDLVLPLFFSKDWPMYQHDSRHSGLASGYSSITSTTVGQLTNRFVVNLDGPVNSKPSIADGKAYIGTSRSGAGLGGTLFKIDLCSGCIEGRFPTNADPHFYPIHGIGGSPAVYNGRVYFTVVSGKVCCIDAGSMTSSAPHPPALWVTDLKNPDPAKNQPVSNPSGDCWTSPLVVNDKVYVGSGEGEQSTTWGFIWCLDANTGTVLWLFCTNKDVDINNHGSENQPNKIPRSAAVSDPLPAWATAAGFSIINDPPETGSSPWSSFSYNSTLNQVYVGTGNSQYPAAAAPDQRYGSGCITLDANTGQFRGFHTSQPDDSYNPNDFDIDVPGSPTIFYRAGQRVVCYGSKNGSFFLLDPGNLQVLGGGGQRRQLIARQNGSGHPGNRGNEIPGVATAGSTDENRWGVMGTPATHAGLGKIFVGLGGYMGARGGTRTPFIRALDWNNLNDAWPTVTGLDGITRYSTASPPLYLEDNEAALGSPAVVNDVVFVSTTNPARSEMSLYALDAATGLCLWAAPKVSGGGWPYYALGPAISGEYVVAGAGEALHIYTRPGTPWCLCWRFPWWKWLVTRLVLPPWPPELVQPRQQIEFRQ